MRKGFTLVELLIVISIIGVLAGFLFVNFSNVRERGRDSRRKNDLNQIKTALRLYYNDYQKYPTDNGSGGIIGCGTLGDQVCTWGGSFGSTDVQYMKLPLDPLNQGLYVYKYAQYGGDDGFRLTVYIENNSDPAAHNSQRDCGIAEVNLVDNLYMICSQ